MPPRHSALRSLHKKAHVIMKIAQKRLGFEFIHGLRGGSIDARFACTKCPETLTLSVGNKSPGDVAAMAQSHAWLASATRKQDALCPKCQAKKLPNNPEEDLAKFAQRQAAALNPPNPIGDTPMAATESQSEEQIVITKLSLVPRAPTVEQRAKIRNLLDNHFDDSIGRFLDGMSDRAIGEKVNVPAVVVRQIREAAYGAEKADPELASLADAIERMEKDLVALKDRVAKALDTK